MMSQIDSPSAQFCSDVDAILSNYWRGYYSNALRECETRLKEHGFDLVEWERLFMQAVQIYLRTWNQDSACIKFLRALHRPIMQTGVQAQWTRFFQELLYTWLCCQERANFDRLTDARKHADEAANMLARIGPLVVQQLSEPLEKYPFSPRPWCIFWFRALARHALAFADEAAKDFERAHRGLRHLSEERRGREPFGRMARLKRIHDYCHESALLAARFYGDMGMFLFEMGDMRMARDVLQLAVGTYQESGGEDQQSKSIDGIDPYNPYVLSNLGFILYSLREDDRFFYVEALDALVKAYELAEHQRSHTQEDDYYSSGRVYYFLGAFAYRWLHREAHPFEGDTESKLEKSIAGLHMDVRHIFHTKSQLDKVLWLAFEYYLKAKDLARALPALVISADPLSPPSSEDPMTKGARRLLWEYSYGMGDFLASQTRYQRMTDQYLLEGLFPRPEEKQDE